MPILKDQVQILRVHEQSNSSQIVVALGRRLGQFRVMAKGVRRWPKKGFEGGFDLLARGELLAYPRPDEQLWIFKEWDEQARPALGQSYRMLAAGSYLCELTEALTRMTAGNAEPGEGEAGSEHLFDLLAVSAAALAERVVDPGILLLNFTLNALANEGVLPDLERCQTCESPFFSASKNKENPIGRAWMSSEGLECPACFRERKAGDPARSDRGAWLGAEALRALLHVRRTLKPIKVSASAGGQLASALALLVHGAIERDLRTLGFAMGLVRGR